MWEGTPRPWLNQKENDKFNVKLIREIVLMDIY